MGWDLWIETPLNYSFIKLKKKKNPWLFGVTKDFTNGLGLVSCELKLVLIVLLHKKSKWDDNFFVGHKKAAHEMKYQRDVPLLGLEG